MSRPLHNITNTNTRLSMGPTRKSTAMGMYNHFPSPSTHTSVKAQPQQVSARQSSIGIPNSSLGRTSAASRASSIGGTRQSLLGGRRSHDGRKSMGAPLKDTRNITDKEFQRSAVRNIIEYLACNNYPKQFSQKSVSAPSTKDFLSIIEFMFQQYENSSYKIGAKPEEYTNDVMHIFSVISYPFPLQKSNISTVGAQHAWPAFLAALDWFVSLLKGAEEPNNQEEEYDFFDYLCKSYSGFLSGGDEYNLFEEQLAQDFEKKDLAIQTDIDNLNTVKFEVVREMEGFANSPDRIAILEARKSTLLADIQKFNTLIEKLDAHYLQMTRKIDDLEKECNQRARDLCSIKEERTHLEAVVAQQEEQSVDAAKINKERSILEDCLRTSVNNKEQANKKNWDQEVTNSKKVEEISRLLISYEQLQSRVQRREFRDASLFESEAHRKGLFALKEEFVAKILQSMDEENMLDVQFRALEEQTCEKREQIASEEAMYSKLEALYQKEKEKWVAAVSQVEAEIQLSSKHIDRMKADTANELGRSHKSVDTLAIEREEITNQLDQQRRIFNEAVIRMVDRLAKHKELIHKKLQDVTVHHSNAL